MAAPKGNQNARKGKIWTDAIRKALAGDKRRLERLARALLDKAESGDMQALKELGDRLEGKAVQSHEVGGNPSSPIETRWTVEFINASKDEKPE